jgi:hypothetical protein
MRAIADIIMNAIDKDYSLEQAATDLGKLMNKLELIKRRYSADYCSPLALRLRRKKSTQYRRRAL